MRVPLRTTIKWTIASGIGRTVDLDRRIASSCGRYVLAYHRVIDPMAAAKDHVHDAMWVSPETFRRQIRWMQSVGEIVDYRRLLDFTAPNSRPLFALTFDDGWVDTYDCAFPVLRESGTTALVFLVSGAMETGQLFWPEDVVTKTHRLDAGNVPRAARALRDLWPAAGSPPGAGDDPSQLAEQWVEALKLIGADDRQARIDQYFRTVGADATPLSGYIMSWEQANRMLAAGFAFGSHTHTHRILKGLSESEMEFELSTSRSLIQANLGSTVDAFCYPNARFSGREASVLARCGYRLAFKIDGRAVRSGVDPFYLPRFIVSERSSRSQDQFRLYLLAAPGFAGTPHDPRERA